MRNALFSILLFTCVGILAQGGRVYPYSVTPSSAECTGWSGSWLGNNNTNDETGVYDLTGHSVVYGTSSPPEGSHYFDLNASGRFLDGITPDLGNTFSLGAVLSSASGSSKTFVSNYNGSIGFIILFDIAADDITLFCIGPGGTNHGYALNASIPVSTWFDFAATFNKTAGTWDCFINGSSVVTDADIRTDFPTDQALSFGSYSGGNYWFGLMDAIFWYPWILTGQQITDIATTPGEEQCE